MANSPHKSITQVEAQPLDFSDVEPIAKRIDSAKEGICKNVILIGEQLSKAQEKLSKNKSGTFKRWVEERCGFSFMTGCRMMNAASVFGGNGNKLLPYFSDTSMYLLAAPSTPRDATEEAMKLAKNGEYISHARAQEIVANHKPEPPEKPFNLEDAENELHDKVHAIIDKWPEEHLHRAMHWLGQIAKGVS